MSESQTITCAHHPKVVLVDARMALAAIHLPGRPRYVGFCQACADEDGLGLHERYSYGYPKSVTVDD